MGWTPVLVVGMHRGGTSAVGRLLAALGLDTGPEDRLIGATDHNPFGHFEVRALTDLNDELLAAVGASWLAPPEDPVAVAALADTEFRSRAEAALADQFGDRPWFWKDPRLSLLLPFWTRVLPSPPLVLCVVRDPAAVGRSLAARDGLDAEFGTRLTGGYLDALGRDAAGLATVVVDYETALADPADLADLLAGRLGEHGLPGPFDTTAAAAALDASANHQGGADGRHGDTAAWHGGPMPDVSGLPGLHPGERPLANLLAVRLVEAGHLRGVADERLAALVDLRDRLGRVEGELADRRDDLTRTTADLVTARDRIGHLDGVLADRVADVGRLTRERDTAHAERDTAHAERDTAHTERARALAEVEAIRAFRAAEVASTTYQLVALVTRIGARLAPAGTRRRRIVSAVLRRLRSIYSRLRRIGRARPAPPAAVVTMPEEGPAAPEPVHLDRPEDPVAAIVVPVHGQVAVTHRCLASIAAARVDTPFEVVVVDDASPDGTAEFLASCSGIEVVVNVENQGYLRSTNLGAAASTAPFLILLNNDTEVSDGWIDDLLGTFDRHPDTGVAGVKLVYPDGRLQEAGGIVFNDGSGWNYGRFQDPEDEAYAHVREVDYCSAACIAVRRELWDDVGGFDDRYAPAYYEDTDLAFAVRAADWKVRVQPAVRVVHHEGVSHGTDESSGLKAHQRINLDTFVAKWAVELGEQHPNDPEIVWAASARPPAGRVFVADYEVPHWDRHSGALRMSRIVRILVDLGWQVTFAPGNRAAMEPYTSEMRQWGVEVVCDTGSPERFVAERAGRFDVAVLSRPEDGARWLSAFRAGSPTTRVVYDTVDLHVLRMERGRALGRDDQTPERERQVAEMERRLIGAADLTLVVSEFERQWLAEQFPDAPVAVIGNVHAEPRSETGFGERAGVLFVGSWRHHPNQDAVDFLLSEVAPLVWEQRPDLTVHLAGSDLPEDLGSGDDRVVRHGWVEDLAPLYDRVRLTVAPLRYGAGLKGKVGESLCRGVPMVGTTVAFEGYDLGADTDRVVADDAAGLAAAILDVHDDEGAWAGLAERGRALVLDTLGESRIADAVDSALRSLTGP